jgi:hypothetical protein
MLTLHAETPVFNDAILNRLLLHYMSTELQAYLLDWYKEVQLWSIQDQISMPFALWKNNMQDTGKVLPTEQVRTVYYKKCL